MRKAKKIAGRKCPHCAKVENQVNAGKNRSGTQQKIVDNAPTAKKYCTDGWIGYTDVVYPGKYVRNVHNKNDTFTVEGVNADLQHYIPILRRRSRCFPRKLETLYAVLSVFVDAYNAFGAAKMNFRKNRDPKSRELPFSVLDFL